MARSSSMLSFAALVACCLLCGMATGAQATKVSSCDISGLWNSSTALVLACSSDVQSKTFNCNCIANCLIGNTTVYSSYSGAFAVVDNRCTYRRWNYQRGSSFGTKASSKTVSWATTPGVCVQGCAVPSTWTRASYDFKKNELVQL